MYATSRKISLYQLKFISNVKYCFYRLKIFRSKEKKKSFDFFISHVIEILCLLLLKLSVQCVPLFLRTIFRLSGRINDRKVRKVAKYIITQISRNLDLKNAFDAVEEKTKNENNE